MEDKVLIKSKSTVNTIVAIAFFALAVLTIAICFIVATAAGGSPEWAFKGIKYGYWGFFVGAAVLVVVGIMFLVFGNVVICVTGKMVYVENFISITAMPIEKINYVGTSMLKTLKLATSSNRVRILLLADYEDVYVCIADQIKKNLEK